MIVLCAKMRRAIGPRLRGTARLELASAVALSVVVVLVAALFSPTSTTPEPPTVVADAAQVPAPRPTPETVAEAVQQTVISDDANLDTLEQDEALGSAIPSRLDRYQVQRGETLVSIATAEDTTVDDLVAWNEHVEADSVLIHGEWLVIPRWESPSVADDGVGAGTVEGARGRGGG